MTKSELRRLQFQRKYTSNEDYENDKANFINLFGKSITINNRTLADLLKQSKWVGANKDYHKPLTLLEDVDTTTIPI